jgi:hypothetical protein
MLILIKENLILKLILKELPKELECLDYYGHVTCVLQLPPDLGMSVVLFIIQPNPNYYIDMTKLSKIFEYHKLPQLVRKTSLAISSAALTKVATALPTPMTSVKFQEAVKDRSSIHKDTRELSEDEIMISDSEPLQLQSGKKVAKRVKEKSVEEVKSKDKPKNRVAGLTPSRITESSKSKTPIVSHGASPPWLSAKSGHTPLRVSPKSVTPPREMETVKRALDLKTTKSKRVTDLSDRDDELFDLSSVNAGKGKQSALVRRSKRPHKRVQQINSEHDLSQEEFERVTETTVPRRPASVLAKVKELQEPETTHQKRTQKRTAKMVIQEVSTTDSEYHLKEKPKTTTNNDQLQTVKSKLRGVKKSQSEQVSPLDNHDRKTEATPNKASQKRKREEHNEVDRNNKLPYQLPPTTITSMQQRPTHSPATLSDQDDVIIASPHPPRTAGNRQVSPVNEKALVSSQQSQSHLKSPLLAPQPKRGPFQSPVLSTWHSTQGQQEQRKSRQGPLFGARWQRQTGDRRSQFLKTPLTRDPPSRVSQRGIFFSIASAN